MNEWISIELEIPKEGVYLFAIKRGGVATGFLSGCAAKYKKPEATVNGRGAQFTHWMPLPAPPK